MDDLRSEQGQTDESCDISGIFSDGVGQFDRIAVRSGIDQRLPAEFPGKFRAPLC